VALGLLRTSWYLTEPQSAHKGTLHISSSSDGWFPLHLQNWHEYICAVSLVVRNEGLQRRAYKLAISVCLPACPSGFTHVTTLQLLNAYSFNFVSGRITKMCRHVPDLKAFLRFSSLTSLIFVGAKNESHVQGYNSAYSFEIQPTFRRNMSPASSGSKNKPS
jgi:hypothetical protein